MDHAVIENEFMRVVVQSDYGARVVSLVDKGSAREWMYGGRHVNVDEDQSYGESNPVGWDECFPTVMACDASDTMWSRPLRDHGDLWGRPWSVDEQSPTSLSTTFASQVFRFSRELSVTGPRLRANYKLVNHTSDPMPYLWALHALLAALPDDRIVVPGVTEVSASYLVLKGETLAPANVPWTRASALLPFSLDRVQPVARDFAGKFYAQKLAARLAAVGHDSQWLVIAWSSEINDIGIWVNYGGWPKQPGTHHVALEPTTTAADDLRQALEANSATWLPPGATARWEISFTLSSTAPV